MKKPALLIFIKNPVKGRVKTRLAKSIGDEQALHIYHQLLKKTREVALRVDADRFLFYADAITEQDEWPDIHYNKLLQKQVNDLGERMKAAFEQIWVEGYTKAIIIGSDCPALEEGHLQIALDKLNEHDAVIGPANDGGYYLLGLNSPCDEAFEGVSWSTSSVLQQTLENFRRANKSWYLLPELTDVDTLEDLEKVGHLL